MKNDQNRRMKFAAGLFCAVTAVVPLAAQAAEDGFYAEGRIGLSLPLNSDLDSATTSQEIDLDRSIVGNVAVGHGYGNGVRTELEFGYRENDIDSISGGGSGTGDVGTWSFMANALYDVNVDGPLKPYFGVGAGIARIDVSGATPSTGTSINDKDTAFAWQGMAGVAYAVSERVKLTLGYRYFSVPDADVNNNAGTSFETDYASHDVMFGLRYSFGAPKKMPVMAEPAPPAPPPAVVAAPPPPPPAPVAAPPVPRNFLVFFDFNSASVSQAAQAIIDSAASAAKSATPVKLRLTGHADRAGPTRYNQRLSLRRAEAVKAALARLGIAGSDVAVFAKGESEPLVATADGVREPQNRRVQIILE